MVARVFNYFCGKKYKCHEPITREEFNFFEMCCNSSLQYLSPDAEGNIIESFGYDQNKFYCRVMGSNLLIPRNKGEEYKLKDLTDKLRHGIYRVKITCENEEFRKIFSFSKDHTYLNITIDFARKHQDKYDIDIQLIKDDKPNALLYKDRDMVPLNSITKEWYEYLMKLNSLKYENNDLKILQHNALFKFICSTAWGSLSEINTINKTEEEIEKENIDIGDENHMYDIYDEVQGKNKHYFVLLNNWSPYKHNIRLKPWITAYSRIIMANLILPNIENVFRVHTDGIVSYKNLTFDKKDYWGNNMWMEGKTTGKIHWHKNNCYKNIVSKDYGKWLVKNKIEI